MFNHLIPGLPDPKNTGIMGGPPVTPPDGEFAIAVCAAIALICVLLVPGCVSA